MFKLSVVKSSAGRGARIKFSGSFSPAGDTGSRTFVFLSTDSDLVSSSLLAGKLGALAESKWFTISLARANASSLDTHPRLHYIALLSPGSVQLRGTWRQASSKSTSSCSAYSPPTWNRPPWPSPRFLRYYTPIILKRVSTNLQANKQTAKRT